MPLRKRISIASAAAAAAALALAVLACYAVLSHQLHDQVDNELTDQAQAILASGYLDVGQAIPTASASNGGGSQYTQIVLQTGTSFDVYSSVNDGTIHAKAVLPGVAAAKQIALGSSPASMITTEVDGTKLRMYTFADTYSNGAGGTTSAAIQLARPLTSVDNVLATMRLILAVLLLLGVGLAALLGRLAARRVIAPLAEMTSTAQLIGETEDLTRRLHVREDDEVGQLAASFNEMMERLASSRNELDASVTSQRQLVADASHELRTPVTSLRTNIEVLLEGGVVDEEDRQRLLADVVEQCEELTTLVADLIEVARGDLQDDRMEDTRLDHLMEEALHRARRNNPAVKFTAEMQPVVLKSHPERLMRAINNLLDNAAKHNSPGQPVEVTVTPSALAVRDHGGGIADADLPHVFDRFYRGINSRSRQGSGLGLAIVRQVAEQHGGTVVAANAATGGAIFTLRFSGTAVIDDEAEDGIAGGVASGTSAVTDDAGVSSHAKSAT